MILARDYFLSDDVLTMARNLLGKYIFTKIEGQLSGGIITETEAYRGTCKRASHAFGGKKTARNAVMYEKGGISYVDLCYGVHHLFHIVTNKEGIPDALLIRAFIPTHGEELILKRTGGNTISSAVANGPGKVSRALGITREQNNIEIPSSQIWLEDRALLVSSAEISTLPPTGVDYAGEDTLLPYRFLWSPDLSSLSSLSFS